MQAGKIAGIKLSISPWFLLLLLLFAAGGMLFEVCAVFLSVLWHELAHVAAAKFLGYTVRELRLLPFGGVAKIERLGEADPKNDIVIAFTGPVASFLLAAAVSVVSYSVFNGEWLLLLQVNLMLGCFNLLPALPLDGGRILRACLTLVCGYNKATRATVYFGWLLSAILVGITFIQFMYQADLNLSLLVAAGFIILTSRRELTAAGFRAMRILSQKKADLLRRGVMPTLYFTAREDCSAQDIISLFQAEQYHLIAIVDQNFKLKGTVTETTVWDNLPEKGLSARITEFL